MSPAAHRCLVIGSLNVDQMGYVERFGGPDEAVALDDLRLTAGGHAGNCATALARLGVRARLLARAGDDAFGAIALGALGEARVETDYVRCEVGERTGLVWIPVLPGGEKTFFVARGANERLDASRLDDALAGCDAVVVFDPPPALFAPIAERIEHRLAVFAPGGLAVSAPRSTLATLFDRVDHLIVNGPESARLTGIAEPSEAARRLARECALTAVVTIGAGGCLVATPDGGVARVAGFPARVIDTTGAGDAFVAAFVRALLGGVAPVVAARAGCAAGALATRALGAQSSLATRAELEDLLGAATAATRPIAIESSSMPARDGLVPTLARCADGWRGMIGVSFTADAAAELARAIALELLERQGTGTLLIAPDGRAESEEAARAVADAVRACGLACELAAGMPPPVVNFAIRRHNLLGAVVITASHNASDWNGVKLKVAPGMPPSRELERAIEARRGRVRRAEPRTVDASDSGRTLVAPDLASLFADVLLERVTVDAVRMRRPRVIVDGLHGIAGAVMARVLAGAGCEVRLIGGEPDPTFGGLLPDPMCARSRARVVDAVREDDADLGLVLDGDGDRLGVIDDRGDFVWPHDVLALLVRNCDSRDHRAGRIAVTSPTGSIVGRVSRSLGRSVVETPVGFKHIAPLMRRQGLLLGGGSVGDIGCRGFGFDRDPFAAALLLLELLAVERQPLSRLVRDLHAAFGSSSYGEATIDASGLSAAELEAIGRHALRVVTSRASDVAVSHVDGVKLRLPDDSWLLLRNATTDAVVRVHAEMSAPDDLASIFGELQDSVSGAHP